MEREARVVLINGGLGALLVALVWMASIAMSGWITRPRLLGPSAEQITLALLLLGALALLALAVPVGVGWRVATELGETSRPAGEVRWLAAAAGAFAVAAPAMVVGGTYAVIQYYSLRNSLEAALGLRHPSPVVFAVGFVLGCAFQTLLALGLGALGALAARRARMSSFSVRTMD